LTPSRQAVGRPQRVAAGQAAGRPHLEQLLDAPAVGGLAAEAEGLQFVVHEAEYLEQEMLWGHGGSSSQVNRVGIR
jgi:hypothetical protein